MDNFGDYIVFVDESGDQSLKNADSDYPIFVLAFCIFKKRHYLDYVLPAITELKFDFWGSDTVILHEREMRKRQNAFEILMDGDKREVFFARLNEIMTNAQYDVVSTIIDKRTYKSTWARTPYDVATQFGMERVFYEMEARGQRGLRIPIIFESRGKKEDKALLAAIQGIKNKTRCKGMPEMFDCECASKFSNSVGLQFADMVARPIGNHYLHPESKDRSWRILQSKIRVSATGNMLGYGIKIFPYWQHETSHWSL
ncbi:DUF3800 domain-containing protein [Bifidobacterium sp. ESL0763]|uniref:DUF3800 domain-containing protein n=1 Tax=Bifidobacterium sp. ESL0763 TaxID=2983227 RepID=UPI0023F78213|nr:DUF3800 domain-containing protein [Bifidobacterium sp. ESL0763]MDF7663184.1 DUF3800 domain-containing protein [Bifidobacterium sp. ESL0763]